MKDNIRKTESVTALIIWSAILFMHLLLIIFLGISFIPVRMIFFLIMTILSVLRLRKYKNNAEVKRTGLPGAIAGIFLCFMLILTSPAISMCRFRFQYNPVRLYMRYTHTFSEYIPDKLPEKTDDFDIYFFPGFMNSGHLMRMSFVTDEKTIDDITAKAESEAIGKLDYASYLKDSDNDEVKKLLKEYFGSEKYSLHLAASSFPEYIDDGVIYVMSSNGDWNHPHSECIIVNSEKCAVAYGIN